MWKLKLALLLSIVVASLAAGTASADGLIRGLVTDPSGKPVRGAIIRAATTDTSVSRYTQADGRFEIALPPGTYDVTVDAWGYGRKAQSVNVSAPTDLKFSLSPQWDIANLSGAELELLLPDNAEMHFLRSSCVACHSFGTILRRRGSTAEEWRAFLPTMTAGKLRNPPDTFSPYKLTYISNVLEKYFGPNAPYFGTDAKPPTREQVKHSEISDGALSATIREYRIPSGPDSVPHSIVMGPGAAWFSEIGYRTNKIGRFDMATEKFQEFKVRQPESMPHTGIVAGTGLVWMPLSAPNLPVKLISLDPETGKMDEYPYPNKTAGAHSLALDRNGNLWMAIVGGGGEVWFFDTKKKEFQSYKFPIPTEYPEGSRGSWEEIPGEKSPVNVAPYHVGLDSKGIVWASVTEIGMIVRIDPTTRAVKEFPAPGIVGMRGMSVDRDDNIWFGAFLNHKLGKFDTKTETFKIYSLPTAAASPYGVTTDRKTGYVWYADVSGNNITRFDPTSETFVEYPLPSRAASPRFISVDGNSRLWFTEFMTGRIGVIDTGETKR